VLNIFLTAFIGCFTLQCVSDCSYDWLFARLETHLLRPVSTCDGRFIHLRYRLNYYAAAFEVFAAATVHFLNYYTEKQSYKFSEYVLHCSQCRILILIVFLFVVCLQRLKYHTQINVRSTRGRNSRGRKITGVEPFPGEDKVRFLWVNFHSRIRVCAA
jgi:hypothetical protein